MVVGATAVVVVELTAEVGGESTSADGAHAASARVRRKAIGRIPATVEHLTLHSLPSRRGPSPLRRIEDSLRDGVAWTASDGQRSG